MSFGLRDIDHLMIRVTSLAEAAERFGRLGFTVAPPRAVREQSSDGSHSIQVPRRPYDNRFMLFRGDPARDDIANFLALACLEDQFGAPWPLRRQMSFLWDTEGPKTIVALSEDLAQTHGAMRAAGLEVDLATPASSDTGWLHPDTGEWLPVRARPCVPTFRQLPFMVNAFETDTLQSFRENPWTEHANTALYLAGVTGVSDVISRDAPWMAEEVFGVKARWQGAEMALVVPRDRWLRILTPTGFAALFPGLDYSSERILPSLVAATVVVASAETARRVLRSAGVPFVNLGPSRLAVARQHAANTLLELIEGPPPIV